MTDEDKIYDACMDNKNRGFRMLMDAYQKSVYFFVRRMVVVHDDAEDVTQETFIRVYRSLDQFRHESSLQTWIFTIATNESLRFLHSRNMAETELADELSEKLMASDFVDYDNALAVTFQKAILSLPEKQRTVFNLRYYEELEYSEISKITGIKAETLKVDYHFAKDKIKDYILKG